MLPKKIGMLYTVLELEWLTSVTFQTETETGKCIFVHMEDLLCPSTMKHINIQNLILESKMLLSLFFVNFVVQNGFTLIDILA